MFRECKSLEVGSVLFDGGYCFIVCLQFEDGVEGESDLVHEPAFEDEPHLRVHRGHQGLGWRGRLHLHPAQERPQEVHMHVRPQNTGNHAHAHRPKHPPPHVTSPCHVPHLEGPGFTYFTQTKEFSNNLFSHILPIFTQFT